ncbi:MAG: PEP-CTERM sorting domain-containing protein [Cyanobacteriota bacterium]|nr:PEP-CTERM sorting domain-containing protein [Cyanobacteriota bacterium]
MSYFNLTRNFVSGATAVTLLAGLGMAGAPQVEAAQLTCTASAPCMLSDFTGTDNFFVTADKFKFGDFGYVPAVNAPEAEGIKVFGEKVGKKVSIVFEGLGEPLFEVGSGEFGEASLFHTVEILKPDGHFKDLHLSFEAEGVFAGITESVFDTNVNFPVTTALLEVNTFPPASFVDVQDVSDLKLSKIRAEKDIELFGLDETAKIFSFRQSYTHDIPEPATVLGLLTIGGLGFGLKRKSSR